MEGERYGRTIIGIMKGNKPAGRGFSKIYNFALRVSFKRVKYLNLI
jgi:hypothetical protein